MKSIVKVKLTSVVGVHMGISHWLLVKEMSLAGEKKKRTKSSLKMGKSWDSATGYLKIKDLEMLTDDRKTTEHF